MRSMHPPVLRVEDDGLTVVPTMFSVKDCGVAVASSVTPSENWRAEYKTILKVIVATIPDVGVYPFYWNISNTCSPPENEASGYANCSRDSPSSSSQT